MSDVSKRLYLIEKEVEREMAGMVAIRRRNRELESFESERIADQVLAAYNKWAVKKMQEALQ